LLRVLLRGTFIQESFNLAEDLTRESSFADARDSYTLSILADRTSKIDKLRKRCRCLAKLGDTG